MLCSGSVINHRHILTSASCAIQCGQYRLRYNSVTFYTGGQYEDTIQSFIHPYFNPITNEHDVAVIRTPPRVFNASNIIRISNPESNSNKSMTISITTSGWGTMPNWNQSPILRFITGIIEDTNETNQMIRAHFNGDSNVRTYDSGSPLVMELNGKRIQIGIATGLVENNDQLGLFTNLFNKNIYDFVRQIAYRF